MHSPDDGLLASMLDRGVSRRAFLQFAAAMSAALALPAAYAPRIAAAVAAAPRIPVVWLHGQSCGGNTRAFLQASDPTTAELMLDLVSVEYHETLMARSGSAAEARRGDLAAAWPDGYLALVEGAIPVDGDGAGCTVGGRAMADIVREVCAGARATIAVGSCAFDGGAPAAGGSTTDAVGIGDLVPRATLINLPGCPVNVVNLTATIVHYLTFGTMPVTDARQRPLFAYGGLLHNQCERRAHFEFGEFVQDWGDEGAQKGWCLYKLGCKGPETFADCPTERYADGTSWPVRAGHGCIGCTTAGFWDAMGPVYDRLPGPLPFASQVSVDEVGLVLVGGVAAVTAVHGAASAVRMRRWRTEEQGAMLEAAGDGRPDDAAVGTLATTEPPGDATIATIATPIAGDTAPAESTGPGDGDVPVVTVPLAEVPESSILVATDPDPGPAVLVTDPADPGLDPDSQAAGPGEDEP